MWVGTLPGRENHLGPSLALDCETSSPNTPTYLVLCNQKHFSRYSSMITSETSCWDWPYVVYITYKSSNMAYSAGVLSIPGGVKHL